MALVIWLIKNVWNLRLEVVAFAVLDDAPFVQQLRQEAAERGACHAQLLGGAGHIVDGDEEREMVEHPIAQHLRVVLHKSDECLAVDLQQCRTNLG